jgi:hypothetical protein
VREYKGTRPCVSREVKGGKKGGHIIGGHIMLGGQRIALDGG